MRPGPSRPRLAKSRVQFSRLLEGLTDAQLEEVALHWRFPEPLPTPLPSGASELDGLDEKSLRKLWKESEREISRIMPRNERAKRTGAHVLLASRPLAGVAGVRLQRRPSTTIHRL